MGTAHGARPQPRRQRASVPPLPPTLVVEGADQPFCLEIVAAQAFSGLRARNRFMAATGYTRAAVLRGLALRDASEVVRRRAPAPVSLRTARGLVSGAALRRAVAGGPVRSVRARLVDIRHRQVCVRI